MLTSDHDRQRVIDELGRHCRAGRIDVEEYGRRVSEAHAATDLAALDRVLEDLPMLRIADPAERAAAGGRPRGHSWGHPGPGSGSPDGDGRSRPGFLARRWASRAFVVLSLVVVAVGVVLAVAVQWLAAVLLVAGWAVGLVTGRSGRARGRW